MSDVLRKDAGTTKAWLRDYLKQGDVDFYYRNGVIEAGEAAGMSRSAICAAATQIGVHAEYESGHKDGHPFREAQWSLPASQ
jgi:hypothetical protein